VNLFERSSKSGCFFGLGCRSQLQLMAISSTSEREFLICSVIYATSLVRRTYWNRWDSTLVRYWWQPFLSVSRIQLSVTRQHSAALLLCKRFHTRARCPKNLKRKDFTLSEQQVILRTVSLECAWCMPSVRLSAAAWYIRHRGEGVLVFVRKHVVQGF